MFCTVHVGIAVPSILSTDRLIKSPHPGEEVEHQNVSKGKVCCIHVKEHLEVVISFITHIPSPWGGGGASECKQSKHINVIISEHITDILLGLLVFT